MAKTRAQNSKRKSFGGSRQGGGSRPGGQGGHRPLRQGGRNAAGQQGAPAHNGPVGAGVAVAPAPVKVSQIELGDTVSVRELAELMSRSPIEIIKVLMGLGIMASINQTIDFDTAYIVGQELGIEVKQTQPPIVEEESAPEEKAAPKTLRQRLLEKENPADLVARPPIVTVLGHVDHGKTTLLDAIRQTDVVSREAGGITQHIGAYQVEIHGRKITFLDTPGHEAFTAMRARGAQATDIAVLVVAADDGVQPQTREALSHARAAQVPVIVALNKVDKPNAQIERVKHELAELGLVPEEWGGATIVVPVSAKQRIGIEELLENILLVADVEGVKANPNRPAVGTVIEARLDRQFGPSATLLVLNGTLRVGDSLVIGTTWGRVRAMFDDRRHPVQEAPPAMPVLVVGLSDVPSAGDTFEVVEDERTARTIAASRQQERAQAAQPTSVGRPMTLADLQAQISAGKVKELNIILKADVQGSLEPIVGQLNQLSTDKAKIKILHQAIGNVTESDVMLASASNAIIVGFNVSVDPAAQRNADSAGVEILLYDIIYRLVEDMDKALRGMLEPTYQEVETGRAEVRMVIPISKGKVAGCYVTAGALTRNSLVRVKRGQQVVYEGRIASLRRFKNDVMEVRQDFECGIGLDGFDAFEVGDIIEAYKKERVPGG